MPRSDWNLVSKSYISVPYNYNEQEKIGQLFQKLDHTITLHEEKQRQLEQLKKALLQKMFADKSGYPKLRFKGFDDTWKQQKLGELGRIYRHSINPNLYPKDKFIDYSMPAYDAGKKPQVVLGSSILSSRLSIKGNLLLINKLNVHQRRIWLVNDTKDKSVASSEFLPYSSNEINLTFLSQFMTSDKATKDLMAVSSGSSNSQKRITPGDLLNYSIYFPKSENEQEIIGNLFNNFDSLIVLYQHKIDKLKRLKQALLQKMFV